MSTVSKAGERETVAQLARQYTLLQPTHTAIIASVAPALPDDTDDVSFWEYQTEQGTLLIEAHSIGDTISYVAMVLYSGAPA